MDEAGTSTANVAATESELAAAEDMFKRGIECVNVRRRFLLLAFHSKKT